MTEPELPVETKTDFEKIKIKPQKKNVFLSRLKRKFLKHLWVVRGLIMLSFLILFFIAALIVSQLLKNTQAGFYTSLLKDFIFTPEEQIKSADAETNIVILGKGGKGHEAPDLTDSIIFAAVNHSRKDVVLVSIPRDIWIPELRAKINSAYYWGNQKEPPLKNSKGEVRPGGGLVLSKSVVEEVVGQPIHYAIVIDFSGFKDIVDVLGGVDVNVDKTFTDEHYPIAGRENDLCDGDKEFKCRYETIKFEAGMTHMDGSTALKFVRSRYAEGEEGTDLARAARQQRIIEAIKKKALSKQVLLSPKKIIALKDALLAAIETDLTPSAAAILARRLVQADLKPRQYVLSEDFLEVAPKSPKYDNLYVFIPKGENWDRIHDWIKCIITGGNCK